MNTVKNVERVFNVIEKWLTYGLGYGGSDNYERILDAIEVLVLTIDKVDESEAENIWHLGEFGSFCLDDFIIGAYWHLSEWHGGQNSHSYRVLSRLGTIFHPNMNSEDTENMAYVLLNSLADKLFNRVAEA